MRLYDSLSGRLSEVSPLRAGRFGLYVCGMTVYDHCHIGHARTMLVFDLLVRHLRSGGLQVDYVRNITDVDDRIIVRAGETGQSARRLTETMTASMHSDFARLGMLPPTAEPPATGHIAEILALTAQLMEAGLAYATDSGDVYFRVSAWPNYGRLSGRHSETDQAHSRQTTEAEARKENARDFVLWKAATEQDQAVGAVWDSPWGPGRPGWHIECSAMSVRHLGAEFDLHGGGLDLLFPHHENELAQSEGAGCAFARRWMHVAPLRMGADKMAKSLGNTLGIAEALARWPAEAVRYALINAHYRTPLQFSEARMDQAAAVLNRWYALLEGADPAVPAPADTQERADFEAALNEDLNVPEALAALHALVRRLRQGNSSQTPALLAELTELANRLGLVTSAATDWFGAADSGIARRIEERGRARQQGDYSAADRIRRELAAEGIELLDGPQGTRWRRSRSRRD